MLDVVDVGRSKADGSKCQCENKCAHIAMTKQQRASVQTKMRGHSSRREPTMKKLLATVVAVATAIAIISCGGAGAPVNLSPTARAVQNMQRFSFLSMGN